MEVAIIDYKMGNLHSVKAACDKVGLASTISSDPDEINDCIAAILPGVGSFAQAMKNINELHSKSIKLRIYRWKLKLWIKS